MKTLREPVFRGAADRVVRLRPDACFDVAVERLEPVLDDGLGLAGDFAPDPLAVRIESEADHSPPPTVAVPVPVAVTARRIMLEEDPVFAPSASCTPGSMIARLGAILGANCQPYRAA